MIAVSPAKYTWRSYHVGFDIHRESWANSGYDPYDTLTPYTAWQKAFIAEMEQCWQACVKDATPAPGMILVDRGVFDACRGAYYDYLATPDRGHEFLPYELLPYG